MFSRDVLGGTRPVPKAGPPGSRLRMLGLSQAPGALYGFVAEA